VTIAAGELRERIVIQRSTAGVDAGSRPIRSWAAYVTLPAKCEAVAGGQLLRGRSLHVDAELVATVRYRSDLRSTDRVVWNGTTYGLVTIGDPYGDRRELRLQLKRLQVTVE
jgi:SPP1 family predicted phage head-tail adaptor